MNEERKVRVAVAEREKENRLAPRLGRAVKFAIFDASRDQLRGPFYRVRHDDPGESCDSHEELAALLGDCQAVIAGSVGDRMAERLRAIGVEAVAADSDRKSEDLVTAYLSGFFRSHKAPAGTKDFADMQALNSI